MDEVTSAAPAATVSRFSRFSAWLVLVLVGAVLVGWVFDIRVLTSLVPGYTTMKFNTAVCLALLACALLARRAGVVWALCSVAAALAGASVLEMVTGRSLGIDELVVQDLATTGGAAPGRMAPATGVAVLSLAFAIGGLTRQRGRLSQGALSIPLTISALALLGYLFDAEQLYTVASLSSVALHTAIAILVLTVAVAARIPGGLLPWAVSGTGPGAIIVRRTTPIIVVGITVFGLVRRELGDHGVFGEHFGIALMVAAGIMIAVGTTVFAATRLDVSDARRLTAEASLRDLVLSLEEGRDEAWSRAEELARRLAAERERFDRAVSATESVVWTVESTAGGLVPIYVSSNVERVLGEGLGPEESAIDAIVRLVDEDQRPEALEVLRSVRNGIPVEVELRISVEDRAKWIRVRAIPRREGTTSFCDGIMIDETEQHLLAERRELVLAQEQLQVERLSELNRLRDEFFAVAGHELRTPVAVILGYLEMLEDPDIAETSRNDALEVITRRARQLHVLVERVFDLAKIDSGALDLNPEVIAVHDFVADLVAEHRKGAAKAHVELTHDDTHAVVFADGTRLQQVFDNLLSNAVKYTGAGGHVHLGVRQTDKDVLLEVEDDGIGVSEEELPRIFDRLFRATTAREARIPGTGLGLAVTRSLVEALGGALTARRNEPRGLVFSVSLPAADAPVTGSRR